MNRWSHVEDRADAIVYWWSVNPGPHTSKEAQYGTGMTEKQFKSARTHILRCGTDAERPNQLPPQCFRHMDEVMSRACVPDGLGRNKWVYWFSAASEPEAMVTDARQHLGSAYGGIKSTEGYLISSLRLLGRHAPRRLREAMKNTQRLREDLADLVSDDPLNPGILVE